MSAKIDHYNFELYHFKVGAFLRHSVYCERTADRHSVCVLLAVLL